MFLAISRGLDSGYFVILADNYGPICKIECTDTYNYEECCELAETISKTDRVAFRR